MVSTIFFNAVFLDPRGQNPEAIAVRDGVIVATGHRYEIAARLPGWKRLVDLRGKTVVRPAGWDGGFELGTGADFIVLDGKNSGRKARGAEVLRVSRGS